MRLVGLMIFRRKRRDRSRCLSHPINLHEAAAEDRDRLFEQGGRDRARSIKNMFKPAKVAGFGSRMVEKNAEGRRDKEQLLDDIALDVIEDQDGLEVAQDNNFRAEIRSEDSRVGKEWCSTC